MLRPFSYLVALALLGIVSMPVTAADLPADVLAKSRWMELTRADYEQALTKLPENLRFEFSTSPRRVQGLLNNLLVTKTLAAQARVHGARPAGAVPKGPGVDADKAFAAAELRRIEADAAKAFNARKTAYEQKAREMYTLDRSKYTAPEEVRISDIAVSIKDRGDEAALARAREARQKILGGADFAAVAREYSDDPTSRDKGGALPFVTAKALTPDYAKAVFALNKVGEVPEPIKGASAYHVVRLEERRAPRQQPFEDVRDAIMRDLEKRYVTEQRDARIQAIHSDPELHVNQAAIDGLVNRVDPKLLQVPRGARSGQAAPK
jgi:peptidyl-prolyl cis-trans isomerase C